MVVVVVGVVVVVVWTMVFKICCCHIFLLTKNPHLKDGGTAVPPCFFRFSKALYVAINSQLTVNGA